MAKEFIVYSKTKAEFEVLVSSGEVDASQMGIIAETGEMWWNGVYRPITKTTSFAKDLTGRIEATPEEFIFRTSAGTKSIRDESAVIRRIKGNTSVWGQIAKPNPTMPSDGTVLLALTLTSNQWNTLISPKISVIKGHKYLFEINPLNSSYNATENYSLIEGSFRVNIGVPTFRTAAEDGEWGWSLRFTPASNGFRFQIQCFDLTAIFEAGNEPTTIEEFKKTYPESYYPYCEPEVRSMRATGIEAIGANAFDKDSVVGGLINADGSVTSNDIYSVAKIEVVPYEKYTLTNVANAYNSGFTYALYGSNDTFLSIGQLTYSSATVVTRTGDVTMPMNARYMRVVVHNDYLDSCCVNLKHSGTLTAEEAVYFKEVRMLPDIAKYFPDGMHGIGDVFDEINEENVVTRFGIVDLGTLTWAEYSYTSDNKVFTTRQLSNCAGRVGVMAKYIKTGASIATMPSGTFKLRDDIPNAIYIADNNYTSLDAFVASLQGVLLYYELAEPIATPVTEPLQWDYKVADFGTEKMLSDLPSSPFRADIVYQFNAEGRIRDNSRNIERLEERTKNMATMDDVINAIPTEIATATQRNVIVSGTSFLFLPNILYEYEQSIGEYTIPELVGGNSSYDNVWMLRVSVASSSTLTIPFDVVWENSQAPSFASGAIIELRFRKLADGRIIGDWKIYR